MTAAPRELTETDVFNAIGGKKARCRLRGPLGSATGSVAPLISTVLALVWLMEMANEVAKLAVQKIEPLVFLFHDAAGARFTPLSHAEGGGRIAHVPCDDSPMGMVSG